MYDVKLLLKDSGAVAVSGYGEVDSSPQVLNLGQGLVRGNMILDISAITIDDSDEKYEIHLIGGNDASFTQQVSLICKELGASASLEGNQDSKAGRCIVPFQNEMAGTIYPYVRVRHVISGSTPSINYTARLEKDLPITGITLLTGSTTTTT